MLRLPLMVLVALLVALGSYLFLLPTSAQREARIGIGGQPAGTPPRPVAPSGSDLGGTVRLTWTPQLDLRTAPGTGGSPPRRARRGAHRAARPLPLHLPAVLPARTLSVPILMYHHVAPAPAPGDIYPGLTVTDADFAAQLAYLRAQGYHTIDLRQLFGALYTHKALPARPVVLTFDDGYLDNYTHALPILRHAKDKAEFNIITGFVGRTLGVNTYMTWPQIKALAAAGMEIESHTINHPDLGILPEDKVRYELRDSRAALQRELGIPVQFFAYPDGQPFKSGTAEAQALLLKLLPAYGYVGALLDGPLTTSRQDAQTPYQLERIRVSGGEGLVTSRPACSRKRSYSSPSREGYWGSFGPCCSVIRG